MLNVNTTMVHYSAALDIGMKLHIGVDVETGLVHSLSTTPANVHDVTEAHRLLHGEEQQVWGDAGYIGVQKGKRTWSWRWTGRWP